MLNGAASFESIDASEPPAGVRSTRLLSSYAPDLIADTRGRRGLVGIRSDFRLGGRSAREVHVVDYARHT